VTTVYERVLTTLVDNIEHIESTRSTAKRWLRFFYSRARASILPTPK